MRNVLRKVKLNHKKSVMRQKELTSRNLATSALQSTPDSHSKLHHRRRFNDGNSNTMYRRASTSTHMSDTHDMRIRKEAVEKAYFADEFKKSGMKRWGRNVMFKWRKMDKDVEVVYSALFLLIAIAYTLICKVSTEYLVSLVKKVFVKSHFFQKNKYLGWKFAIFSVVFMRILYIDFFDTEESKT